MTIEQRTPFAARLLKRLVPAQDHDALLGDLNEERERGRSTAWYFTQILAAVLVGSWRDIRGHKIIAARAIVIGLVAKLLLSLTTAALMSVLTGWGFMLGGRWIGLPWYFRFPYSSSLEWTVAVVAIGGDVVVGWLVVRFNRDHGVGLLLACAVALCLLRFAFLAQIAIVRGSPAQVLALSSAALMGTIRQGLLMLGGGYLASRRPEAV